MKFLTKASVVSLATIASTMLGAAPAFASESNLNVAQTNLETPLAWVGEKPAEKFEVMDGTDHITPTNLEIQNSFMNNATGKDNDLYVKYVKDGRTVSKKVGTVKEFEVGIAKMSGTVQDGRATAAGWSVTHQATAKATTSKGAVKNMDALETINSVDMSTDNVKGIKANIFINGYSSTSTLPKEINQAGEFASLSNTSFYTYSGVHNFISANDAKSAGAGHELNGQGTTKIIDQSGLDASKSPGSVRLYFANSSDKLENGDTVTYTTTWTLNATPVGASV